MAFDAAAYIAELGKSEDKDIDIGRAALALAAINQPGVSLDRYLHHIDKLGADAKTRLEDYLKAGGQDDAPTRLAVLKRVIRNDENYQGDEETYDDLQNASLIRVIERRKGLPVSLAILYIQAGRANGWDVAGLDFPGHFLCRIEKDGRRIIFDPFYDCRIMEAADLRSLLKKTRGSHAELSASYFEPASARDILIRLENNIKHRQIEDGEYEAALKTVETMRLVAPGEYRLLLDAGVLRARTSRTESAIEALEEYIKKAPRDRDRHDAAVLLKELKDSLAPKK